MRKKRQHAPDEDPLVQVVFKVHASQHVALQEAGTMLKIDMSSLLRMMIAEHVGEYIARGKRATESMARARNQAATKMPPVPQLEQERVVDLKNLNEAPQVQSVSTDFTP